MEVLNEIEYDKWLPYTEYEKKECDIKLKDGTIIYHCYPNAGMFNKICGKRVTFKSNQVSEIMYRKYYLENLCSGNCK